MVLGVYFLYVSLFLYSSIHLFMDCESLSLSINLSHLYYSSPSPSLTLSFFLNFNFTFTCIYTLLPAYSLPSIYLAVI